jgi:hypothetical protein
MDQQRFPANKAIHNAIMRLHHLFASSAFFHVV